MKSIVVLLLALGVTGPAAHVAGQTGDASGSASGSVSTPSGSASWTTSTTAGDGRVTLGDADGSALPRTTARERTTIVGLGPIAAVLLASALLVVVVLAIVAMTRSSDTSIDTNRRM